MEPSFLLGTYGHIFMENNLMDLRPYKTVKCLQYVVYFGNYNGYGIVCTEPKPSSKMNSLPFSDKIWTFRLDN